MQDQTDENSISIINANIGRAATSWTSVFPGRKEVDRKTAKTCRAAMSIARNKQITPYEALPEACTINGVDEYDIVSIIEKVDPGTKYLLLKHIPEETHRLIKQHKDEMGFSNLDKTIESIVFLALVDDPEMIEYLTDKLLYQEKEIRRLKHE